MRIKSVVAVLTLLLSFLLLIFLGYNALTYSERSVGDKVQHSNNENGK